MNTTGSLTADQVIWHPKSRPWTIGSAVSLAGFMEGSIPALQTWPFRTADGSYIKP
jgi:hypothetical protein